MKITLASATLLSALLVTIPQEHERELIAAGLRFLRQNGEAAQRDMVILVDPRVFRIGTLSVPPRIPPDAPRHASTTLASATIPGVSRVISADSAVRCASNAPDYCMKNGAVIVVLLGHPALFGDSATIDVYRRISRAVSRADSVELRKEAAGLAKYYLRRNAGAVGRLIAKRQGAGWVITGFTVLASS
jgi:hypothetical protein